MVTVATTSVSDLTALTVMEAVRDAIETLALAGINTARLDAQVLLGFVLGSGREAIFNDPNKTLTGVENRKFRGLVIRRAVREPISQIVGQKEFWGRSFAVTQDTLTPRPESETIIAAVLEQLSKVERRQNLKILDLGTGTGCLILTLLEEYPGACGIGVDISEASLAVAQTNSRDLKLEGRVEFIQGDWCKCLPAGIVFDVIISNPPYVSEREWSELMPEVAQFEPTTALKGGEDGLDAYRALAPQIGQLLAPNGIAALEVGAGQADDVNLILESNGFKLGRVCPDLAGVDRVVVASFRNNF